MMGAYPRVVRNFHVRQLAGDPSRKTALLINPPVYDTQYWARWSQPYGLLRIASLLRRHGYRHLELFDFMEADAEHRVHQHRIRPDESYDGREEPTRPIHPIRVEKDGECLSLFKFHFGKTWREFETWMDERGFVSDSPPDEVWISATMTYWWESVRDLMRRLRNRFGGRTVILLGGIYPTLAPEHAARHMDADLIVVGEVEEANDLWTDLSLYDRPPGYAILTPSRGCPYDCAYCAQRTINGARRRVHYRSPEDILAEMRFDYEKYGIRDFALYADYLLWQLEENLQRLLELIVQAKLPFRLHAPEGLDVGVLARSPRLVELLKAAHLQKVYLPCERADDGFMRALGRHHVTTSDFVLAVRRCEEAGFGLRNLDVNAFVLYGLPGERIADVVKTVLFVSEVVGSIIPMLFTPVPTTRIYNEHLSYFKERGWDEDIHMLNGKLYPFLGINEGSVEDYVDLQRLMYTLNAHYRNSSFRVFGETRVSAAFREIVGKGLDP